MNEAKIQLSAEELTLVGNAGWILTKNAIIQKVYALFGVLSEQMNGRLTALALPQEVKLTTAKISKGENYKGLPYVMLDYPRLFTKEDVFAIRTLFWWANYFSVTLHLKGIYKTMFIQSVRKNIHLLAENGFYIGIAHDEWRHELEEGNYISLQMNEGMPEKIFEQHPFLKVSAKIDFQHWNRSKELLLNLFNTILHSLE
jgi:hypothetical protein